MALGLRWLEILPYYKRISFVLFLMHFSQYGIDLSTYGGSEGGFLGGNSKLLVSLNGGELATYKEINPLIKVQRSLDVLNQR